MSTLIKLQLVNVPITVVVCYNAVYSYMQGAVDW